MLEFLRSWREANVGTSSKIFLESIRKYFKGAGEIGASFSGIKSLPLHHPPSPNPTPPTPEGLQYASKRCDWNGYQCKLLSDCLFRNSLIWVRSLCPNTCTVIFMAYTDICICLKAHADSVFQETFFT